MYSQEISPVVSYSSLDSFSVAQLVDLLEHKTRILLAVTKINVSDKEYLLALKTDIKAIQQEIKERCHGM